MMSAESNSEKSVSYQWPRPSFFWYDNDKDLKVCFLMTPVSHDNGLGLLLQFPIEMRQEKEAHWGLLFESGAAKMHD